VDKLRAAGVVLVHCDSHQHVHLLGPIARITIDLCRSYEMNRVRIVNEAPSLDALARAIPLVAMNIFSFRLARMAKKAGVSTVDSFFGFNTSMRVNARVIDRALRASRTKSVELMCHPGYNPKERKTDYGAWNMDWDRERTTILNSLGKCIAERSNKR
jgi:predicted glycoside hydrolase/deacetylase ChbG (UPF0249 family)